MCQRKCSTPWCAVLALCTPMVCAWDVRAEGGSGITPPVTPYRPSVSTPAQLSAPGWLEGEFGLLRARSDSASRDSAPFTLKLAFTPDWGIRLGGEALVREDLSPSGFHYTIGDTAIVLKRRFGVGADGDWGVLKNTAFGLEGGVIAPTGRDGIGQTAYTVNTIFSADLGAWHSDSNVYGTRLTLVDRGIGRWQQGWASSLSHAIGEHFSVEGELSGTRQRGTRDTAQVLASGSYVLSSGSVVDFGMARSLQRLGATTQLFGGITMMLGRVRRQIPPGPRPPS